MLFSKKKSEETLPRNLRRRFHHLQILKRGKVKLPTTFLQRSGKTKQTQRNPLFNRLRKIFFIVSSATLAFSLVYIIFFSSFFNITKVNLEKNGNAVSFSSLSPFLDKLKGKNILFINTKKLIKEIEQTFKNEILLVRINKSYPKRLTVRVDEYPALLNLKVITPEKEQLFVINQIGYAIFENVEQKELPTLFLKTQKPLTGKSFIIPKEKLTPITEAFTKFVDLFAMKIPQAQWKKTERELHLKTEKNFTVWLDLTAPIEPQLLKLKRALQRLDIYNEPLEYIDLRIAGADSEKVIFKRK